jgi:hypothetical protein
VARVNSATPRSSLMRKIGTNLVIALSYRPPRAKQSVPVPYSPTAQPEIRPIRRKFKGFGLAGLAHSTKMRPAVFANNQRNSVGENACE